MHDGLRQRLHGWGRVPSVDAVELRGADLEALTREAVLTRGLGRSYGDASLPPHGAGPVASSLEANRLVAFDETSGIVRAQAGLRLGRLLELFQPRGWFAPVVPGTAEVTLGGMVAADVHGKNHHGAGTFGAHVVALRMRLPDGEVEEVQPHTHPETFRATLGGMGLTGHILEVAFRLERIPSAWIVEDSRAYPDLEALVGGLAEASANSPFTVAWCDLLAPRGRFGRGFVLAGRWAEAGEAPAAPAPARRSLAVPGLLPEALLSDRSIGAFNSLRYALAMRHALARRNAPGRRDGGSRIVSAADFFHPLDAIRNWNLLYGRRGFTQYQCVLPRDASMRSFRRLAEIARTAEAGPFLCVIKDCGDEGAGTLSFPRPGVTFALDFPITTTTQALVDRLNEFVAAEGGRVYLAKDAFTRPEHFAAMEPRLAAFQRVRARLDPHGRLQSALGRRLRLDG
jgi:decaprenylphospho-beta-D-ribofuranose 2-oxidase